MNLKYKYSTLNELKEPTEYNFYGIIYDSSFPTLDESQNRYECTIKIIDPDVNCITNPDNINDALIHLVIKSNNKESMPYIHSVGDIIRVHRGNYSLKKKRAVYLHLTHITKIKASWCIWAGASDIDSKDTHPISCSHANYTFESQDRHKLDFLRSWIKSHFKLEKSLFYTKQSKLDQRNNAGSDNDVLVQVVFKTELDDKVVYFVQDETDGCELQTYKYFNFIEVNDVIRLRSYKVYDKNVILMNKFSNILKIPPMMEMYRVFMNKIALKMKNIDPTIDTPLFSTNSRVEDIKLVDVPKNWGVIPLNAGEYEDKRFDELTPEDKKFKLEVNVLEIFPKPVYNFVSILCLNCSNSYLTVDVNEITDNRFYCSTCKKETVGKLYYNVTLICRENPYANKMITLHISSYDDAGESFFGSAPVDLYRNSSEFQKMGELYKKLTDKDCYVSVIVEAIPTGNGDSDRVYRIIGSYQNNLVKSL